MKKVVSLLLVHLCFVSIVFSQKTKKPVATNPLIDGHPSWIMQGNIYEVNVRQYTKEGTFNAFAKHLDRLKSMGVQTLWFMPINPIGVIDRKGTMGSYYAVSDFNEINPEFGNTNEWRQLVKTAHAKGFKVIIDWVPNHTSPDNKWTSSHPDFYIKDAEGKPAVAFDWADTRQLDYKNPEMEDSMIASMKYWLTSSDIDGFRCDVAWNVPGSFWKKCITQLKKTKPGIFMLAEGDSSYLPKSGFDAVYPWHMFHVMEKIAKGERTAASLDSVRMANDTIYPKNTIQMYFTSNHDENSWNKADYGTFPGAVHAPFAVFSQTMDKGVPLIYGGQEEPVLKAIEFFEKDPMTFEKLNRQKFYSTLLNLRKRNEALSPDASFRRLFLGGGSSVYAYMREKGSHKVMVILNFSDKPKQLKTEDKNNWGMAYNVFTGTPEVISSTQSINLDPWGYAVYEYGAAPKPEMKKQPAVKKKMKK